LGEGEGEGEGEVPNLSAFFETVLLLPEVSGSEVRIFFGSWEDSEVEGLSFSLSLSLCRDLGPHLFEGGVSDKHGHTEDRAKQGPKNGRRAVPKHAPLHIVLVSDVGRQHHTLDRGD
jgi:hypothetical protein